MDAKAQKPFRKSLANAPDRVCPACGKSNAAYRKACGFCGAALSSAPPEAPVQEEEEPLSAFAQGLPDWDLEPPQILVRRRRR